MRGILVICLIAVAVSTIEGNQIKETGTGSGAKQQTVDREAIDREAAEREAESVNMILFAAGPNVTEGAKAEAIVQAQKKAQASENILLNLGKNAVKNKRKNGVKHNADIAETVQNLVNKIKEEVHISTACPKGEEAEEEKSQMADPSKVHENVKELFEDVVSVVKDKKLSDQALSILILKKEHKDMEIRENLQNEAVRSIMKTHRLNEQKLEKKAKRNGQRYEKAIGHFLKNALKKIKNKQLREK